MRADAACVQCGGMGSGRSLPPAALRLGLTAVASLRHGPGCLQVLLRILQGWGQVLCAGPPLHTTGVHLHFAARGRLRCAAGGMLGGVWCAGAVALLDWHPQFLCVATLARLRRRHCNLLGAHRCLGMPTPGLPDCLPVVLGQECCMAAPGADTRVPAPLCNPSLVPAIPTK